MIPDIIYHQIVERMDILVNYSKLLFECHIVMIDFLKVFNNTVMNLKRYRNYLNCSYVIESIDKILEYNKCEIVKKKNVLNSVVLLIIMRKQMK